MSLFSRPFRAFPFLSRLSPFSRGFTSGSRAQRHDRPVYNESGLAQYFDRIHLAPSQRIFSVASLSSDEKLAYLTLLQKHHLVAVPYENLQAHYSWHRGLSVSTTRLFQKIVCAHRGGWCFEANQFLNTVLLSLGYKSILAASRVFEPQNDKYGGIIHCVNIVSFGGVEYLLDVGFGGHGPPRPVPLLEEPELVQATGAGYLRHTGPQAQMRVVRQAIPQQVSQDRLLWLYQFRAGSDQEWKSLCCFSADFELIPEDIELLNVHGMGRTCFLSHELLVQRFTTSSEPLDASGPRRIGDHMRNEIDGFLVLYQNKLKWQREGEVRLHLELKTEAERIEALRQYFGLMLDDEECDGIRGSVGEIRESWFGANLGDGFR